MKQDESRREGFAKERNKKGIQHLDLAACPGRMPRRKSALGEGRTSE
jgi:hypothetical protein